MYTETRSLNPKPGTLRWSLAGRCGPLFPLMANHSLRQGGKSPKFSSALRIKIRRGWLRSNADTVARRQPFQPMVVKPKVLHPSVLPGVEQGNGQVRGRIGRLHPVGFVQVTRRATPGEVCQVGRAASGARDNVLDVERGPWSDWCIRQYSHRPAARASTARAASADGLIPGAARAGEAPRLAPRPWLHSTRRGRPTPPAPPP